MRELFWDRKMFQGYALWFESLANNFGRLWSVIPMLFVQAGVSFELWSRVVPLETPFQTSQFPTDIVAGDGRRRKHEEVECALSLFLPAVLFIRAGVRELCFWSLRAVSTLMAPGVAVEELARPVLCRDGVCAVLQ
ncbi:hypothetical protein F511_42135 [Dorcoceras hygrometricum]|uniref:Uncharacterized protein n=1 Tax=Dorcoceras hygrometricum TaxID=472368 RepID=A0A2Z7AHM4_9LAMI|nr:hypothetical protein F511_42135 [Dorcoceras hygrometricum]